MSALEYGFYDSYDHDRLYNAEQMNSIFEGVITDGVYAGVGNHFAVHPGNGLQVVIDTGRAWFKMTWNKNRTLTPLYLDMPDPVYDRIDTICIRVRKNLEHRMNDFYVYRGNITSNPTPPTLNDTSDTFYLPLANVTVRANAESISTADIEMLVGKTRCPFVTSILQQTDITDLFRQWEGQFVAWWESVRHILDLIEGGNVGEIFLELDKKVNRSEKATSEDLTLNSDSTWMTPLRTREMIDSIIGDLGDRNNIVTSFKGRTGAVVPEDGDYTASQVGALSVDGGTVAGPVTINGLSTLNNIRIQNGAATYGGILNFGNADLVHISEPTDNAMEIKANSVNFVLNGSSGSANTNFKINGVNPFSGVTAPSAGMTYYLIGSGSLRTTSSTTTADSTVYDIKQECVNDKYMLISCVVSGEDPRFGTSILIPALFFAGSLSFNIPGHYEDSDNFIILLVRAGKISVEVKRTATRDNSWSYYFYAFG